jgi:hypothetical protein
VRPLLPSYKLQRDTFPYTYADLRRVDWLIAALHGFQIREGARLEATDAKHLPKPIKMALRTGDEVSTDPEELCKWIKSLNPGPHTDNWRVLNSREEPSSRRHILPVDWGSANTIKRTGYKIFMGLSVGTFRVLSNPEAESGAGWASGGGPRCRHWDKEEQGWR